MNRRDRGDSPKSVPKGVLAFSGLLAAASAAGVVVTGNAEFVFYLAVLLVLAGLAYWAHRHVGFSDRSLWLLSVWAAMHMAGGLVPVPEGWPVNGETRVLYSLWLIPDLLKYDHVVHAFGFGTMTLVSFEGLLASTGVSDRTRAARGLVLFAGLTALGFGALNEVVEFVATLLIPDTNVGGYVNTGWDLVANLAGVLLVGGVLYVRNLTPRG